MTAAFRWHIVAILLIGALYTPPAYAALFCAVAQGLTQECIYDDPALCRKRAAQIGGVCNANRDELYLVQGDYNFCMVSPSGYGECFYQDRASCDQAANRSGGACVTRVQPIEQPDPYENDPKKLY